MTTAYFECNSGISGDMTVAALIDAGADYHLIKSGLESLKIPNWSMKMQIVSKNNIAANKIDFIIKNDPKPRHLDDIITIINQSPLNANIKKIAVNVFTELAKAEAKCHNSTIDKVHFHEVGAIDSILDIVATAIAIDNLKIDTIIASPLPIGHGQIRCDHGIIPLPAPAVAEMLKGVPIYGVDLDKETITPTGIAILIGVGATFSLMPNMVVKDIGIGAGSRDLEQPNILRVFLSKDGSDHNQVLTIKTTIDDMTGEYFGYFWDKINPLKPLDMWYTPIYMKKGRPGVELTILCEEHNINAITDLIFKETTTIGLRISREDRIKLSRKIITIPSKYGDISYKISTNKEDISCKPEMEDIKKICLDQGISQKEALSYANFLYYKQNCEEKNDN